MKFDRADLFDLNRHRCGEELRKIAEEYYATEKETAESGAGFASERIDSARRGEKTLARGTSGDSGEESSEEKTAVGGASCSEIRAAVYRDPELEKLILRLSGETK